LKDIFGFEYTLECYLPPEKRTYGYFCLPVLFKDQFIGRIDVKADRKNRTLFIRKEFWNENYNRSKMEELFDAALAEFASFNQCEKIR
jgi:uncharacterized protein YcaQ